MAESSPLSRLYLLIALVAVFGVGGYWFLNQRAASAPRDPAVIRAWIAQVVAQELKQNPPFKMGENRPAVEARVPEIRWTNYDGGQLPSLLKFEGTVEAKLNRKDFVEVGSVTGSHVVASGMLNLVLDTGDGEIRTLDLPYGSDPAR